MPEAQDSGTCGCADAVDGLGVLVLSTNSVSNASLFTAEHYECDERATYW